MKVTRNPQDINPRTGDPKCTGNFSDDSQICTHHCGHALSCSNETDNEEKRRESRDLRTSEGRRLCFGHLYSENSEECQNVCRQSFDCSDVMNNEEFEPFKAKSPFATPKTSIPTTLTGIRSPGLNVLQPKPPIPMPYYPQTPSYSNPFQSSSYTSTTSQYQNPYYIDEKTQAYLKAKYGVGLKIDPTVPGQFEGEEWYVRFFKEVFKYAGSYALQLLGHILVNNRWAPNLKQNAS